MTDVSSVRHEPNARRLDVLVLDDHAGVRRLLELSLGHLGHLVVSTATLAGARNVLRESRFDVVLCDILLPDGDGVELLERWPPSVRRVPVIAISGVCDPSLSGRCVRAGFDAFVGKPFEVADLSRAIWRLLEPGS